MTTRIIFMGTPDFAVPALNSLHSAYNVVAVVTQPDRASGRGRKIVKSAVKQAAEKAKLNILQPANLNTPETLEQLASLKPDLIVVAAYGQILRANVLNMPPLGCINIHASLLPRWRGAAPVAGAIKAGDAETGVTLMQMDEGLDTGPMIQSAAIPILPTHTRQSLTAELAVLGADLLLKTLPNWIAGNISPQAQDHSLATLAPRIKKEQGQIDWFQSAEEIERHIRAFYPWPGTFSFWQGHLIKIISASLGNNSPANLPPGTLFEAGKQIAVATGEGNLILNLIQPAGKRAMPASDFARGADGFVGGKLDIRH